MESLESFATRVLARTGNDISELPVRHARMGDGSSMGHIFCSRGSTFVCATGYPSHVDEDGIEHFDAFEVVVIG